MTLTLYTRDRAAPVDAPIRRLTLGAPIPGAPACDDCRRPASIELDADRRLALCVPCLEDRCRRATPDRTVEKLERKVNSLETRLADIRAAVR